MKGVLLALSTVIVWAILNVVNRFCVLQYDVNIMVFTSFMIFATGVTLMIIRKQVMPQNWKSGVKYSWLYTIMQIIRSFTMISTFLYITSTETSLLFNIEIIITYILAYAIFRRIPYKGDFLGILIILLGFILFIFSLPVHMRVIVSILVLLSATASCIRSIVVEETTIWNPDTSVRQKCGISGYTMFYGGLSLIVFFFAIALLKFFLGDRLPPFLSFLTLLPDLPEMIHPETIISACLAGLFINASTTYLFKIFHLRNLYGCTCFSTCAHLFTGSDHSPLLCCHASTAGHPGLYLRRNHHLRFLTDSDHSFQRQLHPSIQRLYYRLSLSLTGFFPYDINTGIRNTRAMTENSKPPIQWLGVAE